MRTSIIATLVALLAIPATTTAATTKQLERRVKRAEHRIAAVEHDLEVALSLLSCFSPATAGISTAVTDTPYTFDPGSAMLEGGILNYFAPSFTMQPQTRPWFIVNDGPSYLALVNPECVGPGPRRMKKGTIR